MPPKVLELRPNRDLLEPDFNGYKLSLTPIKCVRKQLTAPVYRALPDTGQYSVLHAKLFGLQNLLIGECVSDNAYIYFIDKNWTVQKAFIEGFIDNDVNILPVWQIPNRSDRRQGDYNASLKLPGEDLALVSDGTGMLFILETKSRTENHPWQLLFSEEVLGLDKRFVIQDAFYKIENGKRELHLLLLRISQEKPEDIFENFVSWVVLTENNDKKWGFTALRELRGKGDLSYCYFEPGCNALYIASDSGFKFTVDSENPLGNAPKNETKNVKKYTWSQNKEDIQIKYTLPENVIKGDVKIETKSQEISVKCKGENLLCGQLYQAIDADLTTWNITTSAIEITLNKLEVGLMWPELIEGDHSGELIVDSCIVEDVHQRLQQLTSENEAAPQGGTTFNSQQVEECDFIDDKTSVFERICCQTHNVTHRVNMGTHPVIMTAKLFENLPPALGLRHDVDICLWQPSGENDNWSMKHEGTLLAFGYVQASKQQRKFLGCSPDLNYAIICESNRHVFVYCQKQPVTSGQLRNRTTGRRVNTVAEQRVLSVENQEILGFYITNTKLFLLTESSLLSYFLC